LRGRRAACGAYQSYHPPGVITTLGHREGQPAGGLHFACPDISPYWAGYMEGSIRSGERVADEVLRA